MAHASQPVPVSGSLWCGAHVSPVRQRTSTHDRSAGLHRCQWASAGSTTAGCYLSGGGPCQPSCEARDGFDLPTTAAAAVATAPANTAATVTAAANSAAAEFTATANTAAAATAAAAVAAAATAAATTAAAAAATTAGLTPSLHYACL